MIAKHSYASSLFIFLCIAGRGWAAGIPEPSPAVDLDKQIVLRIGIPTATTPEQTRRSESYRELLSRLSRWSLAQRAGLYVDVAFGSEYQVLDWLEKREIDATLLPPFAAWQLVPDQVSGAAGAAGGSPEDYLYVPGWEAGPAPPVRSLIRSRRLDRSHWVLETGGARAFESFLEDTARAAGDPGHAARPSTRLALPSHFSEGGLLAPLMDACAWLEERSPGQDIDRRRFWDRFFESSHFVLGAPAPPADASSEQVWKWIAPGEEAPDDSAGTWRILEFGPPGVPGGEVDQETAGGGWEPYELDSGGRFTAGKGFPETMQPHEMLVVPSRVVKDLVAAGLLHGKGFVALGEYPRFAEYRERLRESSCVDEALKHLLDAGGPGGASSPRFTLPELHRLIRRDEQTSGRCELALVLPGGGVKAAYQTAIIDHLYGKGLLANVRDPKAIAGCRDPDPYHLVVDLVTGNSGGALIGSFVASLAGDPPPALGSVLWVNDRGKPLDSSDVFPFWDLPRWFTIIVSGVVLLLVLEGWGFFARRWSRSFKESLSGRPILDEVSRWPDFLVWLAFLFAIPIGFKFVNGPFGTEHVPATGGVIYFLAVCLAILLDDCAVIHRSPGGRAAGSRRYTVPFLVSLSLGVALMAIPLIVRFERPGWSFVSKPFSGKMPLGSIIFCAGIFPILCAYVFWVLDRPSRYGKVRRENFAMPLTALIFGCSIPALAYAVLGVLRLTGAFSITFLELTGSFWKAYLPACGAISVLAVVFGALGGRSGGWRRRLFDAMRYLVTRHPTRAFRIHRLARMMLIFVLTWTWWNLIVGPALYGNDLAEAYICGSARRFLSAAGRDGETASAKDSGCPGPVDFQAPFVAPANELARNEERYFLFTPEVGLAAPSEEGPLGEDRELGPQWKSPDRRLLYKVIFASGSPFPIFPAHRVNYGNKDCSEEPDECEWLVDGGYAHNVPIEAAKIMGARQVLVVNSTPEPSAASQPARGAAAGGFVPPHESLFGQLVKNAPRLVPFLYERAQVADVLSMEGLFVASVSPSGDPADWPVLYDFREPVVRRMKEAGRRDLYARIGRVESWGPPVFHRVMYLGRPVESADTNSP